MATTLRLSPVTSPKNVCVQLSHSVVLPASNFSRELLRTGVCSSSWSMSPDSVSNCNLSSISDSPRKNSPGKQSSNGGGGVPSGSCGGYGMDSVKINHKSSNKMTHDNLENKEIPNSMEKSCNSIEEEFVVEDSIDPSSSSRHLAEEQLKETASEDLVSGSSNNELPKTSIEKPIDDSICSLLEDSVSDPAKDAKNSFDATGDIGKSSGSAKVSNSCDFVESGKTSICRGSTSSDVSEDSSSSSVSSSMNKPHRANDARSEAIQAIRSQDGILGLNHFRILRRLGCGDIGSVYLSELSGTRTYFAMKVMDKAALASRKKLVRAQTERDILQTLDHPFLPTLYTHFETEKFSCLVMEFCPGGDLHALRQRQPGKRFSEHAARYSP